MGINFKIENKAAKNIYKCKQTPTKANDEIL